jgi:hypothetical protein
MHTTKVEMKDGRKLEGIVWSVREKEEWFTLIVGDDEYKLGMADCKSVVTLGERISRNVIGDQDMLKEWKNRKTRA